MKLNEILNESVRDIKGSMMGYTIQRIRGGAGTATAYVYTPNDEEQIEVDVLFDFTLSSPPRTNPDAPGFGPGDRDSVDVTSIKTIDGTIIPVGNITYDTDELIEAIYDYLGD